MTEEELEDLRARVTRRKKVGTTEVEQREYWKEQSRLRSQKKRNNKCNPDHPDYDQDYHIKCKQYQKKWKGKKNA